MKFKSLLLGALAISAIACKKDKPIATTTTPAWNGKITDMPVPDDFDYSTITEMKVSVRVNDLEDVPLQGVMVNFYSKDPSEGGQFLGRALTNFSGVAESVIRLPKYLENVFVEAAYPGFANSRTVSVQSNLSLDFGGKPKKHLLTKSSGVQDTTHISGKYYFIGTFNSQGVPNYLEVPGDNLSTAFLNDVNSSFPEREPVPTHNPQYLATGNQLDVKIIQKSDVWVTFVSEGASFKNALVYYVFDSSNPPNSTSDIDSMFVVFPNTSFSGSGGSLNAGDKVKLGTFDAGKTISWAIVADGWKNQTINLNKPVYYSNPAFNTNESDPNKRQHSVQLVDNARQLLLNGFEDLPRSNGGSDDDFNDLMFYVTANPWSACDVQNTPPISNTSDGDGDGVPDDIDEFPSDPAKAYTCNFTGTLAYEDLWPSQGDYDFNDLVLDYDITHAVNANNDVVDMQTDWTVRAVGAAFKNGFGWQYKNLAPSSITSVSGQDLQEAIITNNANGTEQNQQKATIIAFDNVFNIMPNPGTPFINTVKGQVAATPQTISLNVVFGFPQDPSELGLPPYNPFIFINKNRSKEVHLADMAPTDLADMSLLGSGQDDSQPGIGKYYKSENNLPWALSIESSFDYPVEFSPITDAYQNFAPWAISAGLQFPDWYLDLAGNRDATYIY